MPCTPTRSPPSLCARCGWHNPTPAAERLATLQPYTLGKPQHNGSHTQAYSSARHAAAMHYTLLHWKQPLIVVAYNFYSMSFCLCTSATLAFLPEDFK